MTMQRDGGYVTFSCDECPESFELDEPTRDFADAFAAVRAAGWRARNVKGEWEHVCDACRRKNL